MNKAEKQAIELQKIVNLLSSGLERCINLYSIANKLHEIAALIDPTESDRAPELPPQWTGKSQWERERDSEKADGPEEIQVAVDG